MDRNRNTGLSILNNNTVRENVKPHKRYITDDFRWIYKLNNKHNIALSGYVAYNDLPKITSVTYFSNYLSVTQGLG